MPHLSPKKPLDSKKAVLGMTGSAAGSIAAFPLASALPIEEHPWIAVALAVVIAAPAFISAFLQFILDWKEQVEVYRHQTYEYITNKTVSEALQDADESGVTLQTLLSKIEDLKKKGKNYQALLDQIARIE